MKAEDDAEVTYSIASLKRAGIVGGSFMLQLRTKAPAELALEAFTAAVHESNEVMAEREPDELFAQVDAPVPTPGGPTAFVRDCEPTAALKMMLAILAETLTRHGISGRLVPAPSKLNRFWASNSLHALGAGFLLPLDYEDYLDRRLTGGGFDQAAWQAGVEDTRRVVEATVGWVLALEGDVTVRIGLAALPIDPSSVVKLVVQTLPLESMVSVMSHAGEEKMRSVWFGGAGWVGVVRYEPGVPRAEQLGSLTHLLRETSPHVQAAWLRETRTSFTLTPSTHLSKAPPTPFVGTYREQGRGAAVHLEADHVHDAHVVQVMTSAQLASTHDLARSRWNLEDLGADRHLVTAVDPTPWLDLVPDPDRAVPEAVVPDAVLAQARNDFGDAILTIDTLRRRLPPLSPSDQRDLLTLLDELRK